MKLRIGDNEVTISVKGSYAERANKEDTMYFLNDLVCMTSEASKYYHGLGLYRLADESSQYHDDMYNALKKLGFYED